MAHWGKPTPHAMAAIENGYRHTYDDMAGLVVRMAKYLSAWA